MRKNVHLQSKEHNPPCVSVDAHDSQCVLSVTNTTQYSSNNTVMLFCDNIPIIDLSCMALALRMSMCGTGSRGKKMGIFFPSVFFLRFYQH